MAVKEDKGIDRLMATEKQIARFLADCSFSAYKALPDPGSRRLEALYRPIIRQCLDLHADNPRTTVEEFIVASKTAVQTFEPGLGETCVRYLVNLHAFLSDLYVVAHSVECTAYSIRATLDLVVTRREAPDQEILVQLSFYPELPDEHQCLLLAQELHAVARAYHLAENSSTAPSLLCGLFLANGKQIFRNYSKYNNIEAIAQVVDSGARLYNYGCWCRECENAGSCGRK